VDFAVDGDVKYVSHQDTIRMMSRALARAGLPIRYSQGFNPHPRISLPLPRPVGVASDAERVIIEMTQDVAGDDLQQRLQQQLPSGIRILHTRMLDAAERSRPTHVRYRVPVPNADDPLLRQAVDRFLASDSAPVERTSGEKAPTKRVDVRPFVDRIQLTESAVILTLRVTEQGTARPTEICEILGIPLEICLGKVRRIEVTWH
jgi:radical SAM-linked protein